MVGCQKSKCSSSWPPITTFTCIVNTQTFIPAFTQTHSKQWFNVPVFTIAMQYIRPDICCFCRKNTEQTQNNRNRINKSFAVKMARFKIRQIDTILPKYRVILGA